MSGDEMPHAGTNYDPIIATGFYRLGIWDDEPTDRLQARYDNLDDVVTTTGQVFLGLTVDCARCHNHKIDPILQTDYYRLLAFFQNIRDYHNGGAGDEAEVDGPGEEVEHPREPVAGKPPVLRQRALCVSENGRDCPETFVCLRGSAIAPVPR